MAEKSIISTTVMVLFLVSMIPAIRVLIAVTVGGQELSAGEEILLLALPILLIILMVISVAKESHS